jgi:predicted dehydrogenase
MRVRIAIFGVGMHFQETYTTAFKRDEINSMVDVVWVADLKNKKDLALQRCKTAGLTPTFMGVDNFQGTHLPDSIKDSLDELFKKYPVDAVLVSTTPEQHRAYSAWAIDKGLDVLLDKPVTSRRDAAHSVQQAMGILDDWEVLNTLSKDKGTMVMVNSHRRFHPAYHKVGMLLEDVATRYGFGVTSLSSFNSDGQWRMPNELLDIDYHGFGSGNGVLSHFGYHYLDLAATWYKKGTPPERRADRAFVSSSFSLVQNYAQQVSAADAKRVLALVGEPAPLADNKKTLAAFKNFGEMDSFGSIEMYKGGVMTGHINMQMVHSGFSQRTWTKPAANLYKENGRVRWENHLIQQGPLHAIEIRSFQAVQPSHLDPKDGLPRWNLGGSDQLEVNIFRNKLIGGKPLETINMTDLLDEIPDKDVVHEDVKAKTFHLFICIVAKRVGIYESLKVSKKWAEYVTVKLKAGDQDLSLISSHQPTVAFMAASYASYAKRQQSPQLNERIGVDLQW